MSDYEHQRGRLIPQEKEENETVKAYFQRVLKEDFEEDDWNDNNPTEMLYEPDLYEKYFYVNEKLYTVLDLEEVDPYDDIQILKEDPRDGNWFEMKYYNGGTCLSEMIEEAIEKLNK